MTSQTTTGACFCGHTFAQHEPSILKSCDVEGCDCAVYDHDDGSAASGAGVPHNSTVVSNALADPTYRPYCMRCPGLQRMAIVEPLYWRCPVCPAEHDERQCLPTPPSDAGTSERETGGRWTEPRVSCPKCGAHCLTDRDGLVEWCSLVGCDYGIGSPAAPAAEGPQDGAEDRLSDEDCPTCGKRLLDSPTDDGRRALVCFNQNCQDTTVRIRPRAALPGAEAGTPTCNGCAAGIPMEGTFHRYTSDLAFPCSLASGPFDGLVEALTGNAVYDEDTARAIVAGLAALTSEVRDQTAKARAMWEDREGWKRTAAERGFEVTRLTSEARALREDKARLDARTIRLGSQGRGFTLHCDVDLRAAIDGARLASPSPTGAPASSTSSEISDA